jgi:hypothetical protein
MYEAEPRSVTRVGCRSRSFLFAASGDSIFCQLASTLTASAALLGADLRCTDGKQRIALRRHQARHRRDGRGKVVVVVGYDDVGNGCADAGRGECSSPGFARPKGHESYLAGPPSSFASARCFRKILADRPREQPSKRSESRVPARRFRVPT